MHKLYQPSRCPNFAAKLKSLSNFHAVCVRLGIGAKGVPASRQNSRAILTFKPLSYQSSPKAPYKA